MHSYIRISALDCSTDTGKIAAAYEDKVCIFEPTPLIHSEESPTHGLEYRYVYLFSTIINHIINIIFTLYDSDGYKQVLLQQIHT